MTTSKVADPSDARALFGARQLGVDLQGPIAAVGTNTGGAGTHAYVIGFAYGAQVLLRSLTRRRPSDSDELVPEDALIHPLAYCTRHFVELFLKDVPREIHSLRGRIFKAGEHHNIRKLWVEFESACGVDRRLSEFPNRLRDAVDAIAQLDPTGQTFRYRKNKDDETHLKDLAIIYVPQFEQTFNPMFEAVKELYAALEDLQLEYMLGTWTDRLSRADLHDIAICIGKAGQGGKEALRAAQVDMCKQFLLSRSQYQAARDHIERHYRFSQLAGSERPLAEISCETLGVILFAVVEEECGALLSDRELAAVWGVLRVGDVMGASEDYDPQVRAFIKREVPADSRDVIRVLRSKPTQFRKGLLRLGQQSLLEGLEGMLTVDELQQFEEDRRRTRWYHG
jgi:hypothetical protein